MEAPPVLTAERIDAMLSIMAEVCLEGVVEAGARQKAAPDVEDFERAGRSLNTACRNLRQTIAIKQRFDREEAEKARGAVKDAEAARELARRARRSAVHGKRTEVLTRVERLIWDEYDKDDAEELSEEANWRLADLSLADDFLDTPLETLIQRLADDIGLGQPTEGPPDPPPAGEPAQEAPAGEPSAPAQALPPPEDPAEPAPASVAPPDPPPTPPPDPSPQPYAPPWEQLRPGQSMPGGSGW